MTCPECERLKAENARLREALEQLRRMVADMGGGKVRPHEDPYEDERAPEWIWEREDRV